MLYLLNKYTFCTYEFFPGVRIASVDSSLLSVIVVSRFVQVVFLLLPLRILCNLNLLLFFATILQQILTKSISILCNKFEQHCHLLPSLITKLPWPPAASLHFQPSQQIFQLLPIFSRHNIN